MSWEIRIKGERTFTTDNVAEKTAFLRQIEDAAVAAFDQLVQELGDHYETVQHAELELDGEIINLKESYEDAQIEANGEDEDDGDEDDEEATAEEVEALHDSGGVEIPVSDGGEGKASGE